MPKPRRPDTIFWVAPDAIRGDRLTLDREESHHLLHVHRAAPGTPFVAVDGVGGTYECLLESSDRRVAVGAIERRSSGQGELSVPITLLVGLPGAGPAETVVAHAVPLGALAIDFVACDRAGRQALESSRLERLSRVAVSALKQLRRSRLPAIRSSASLEAAIALLGRDMWRIRGASPASNPHRVSFKALFPWLLDRPAALRTKRAGGSSRLDSGLSH